MQFILGTNRLILERVINPEHKLLRIPSEATQVAVMWNSSALQQEFFERKRQHGSKFGFHGSPLHKWYSIMRNGLRVLSKTEFMSNGHVFGEGIYLAQRS